jgi:hypothetical protein
VEFTINISLEILLGLRFMLSQLNQNEFVYEPIDAPEKVVYEVNNWWKGDFKIFFLWKSISKKILCSQEIKWTSLDYPS